MRLTGHSFENIKVIGRGAFGEVRLVSMKRSKKLFAMKILDKSKMVEKHQIAHVRSERDVLAENNNHHAFSQQKNPWVVSLYYSFQDAKALYLIMEYVPGGDMMGMLFKYDTFDQETTKFYIAETILAVESVHQLNYAHRDIKPDNLLLDRLGHLKLSDFGLCTGLQTNRVPSLAALYRRMEGEKHHQNNNNNNSYDEADDFDTPSKLPSKERFDSWKRNRRVLAYSHVGKF